MKKRTAIFIIPIVLITFMQAQDTLWTKRYDTGHDEFPYAGTIDAQGNIIVVGAVGTITGGIPDSASMYIVKYDPNGNFLWARTYRCPNYSNFAFDVVTDSFCNIITVGFYLNLNDPQSITHYEIIKINPNGDTIWTKRSPVSLQDYLYGVTLDRYGDIIAVGGSLSNNQGDIFLVKFSPSGNQIWQRICDLGQDESVFRVALDQTGNIITTGAISNLSTFDFDFLTAKFNADGTMLWSRRYNISGFDEARDITIDSQGSIIVTGYTSDYSNCDVLTIKYDSLGNIVWTKVYNRAIDDVALGITTDFNNNIFVCGGTGTETNHDYLIIKYGSEGDTIWTETFNGGSDDVSTDIKLTAQNDIVVFGASANSQNYDFLTIKYRGSSGIEEFTNNFNLINQNYKVKFATIKTRDGKINLEINRPDKYKIILYNSIGSIVKIIHQGYLSQGLHQFNLNRLQNGVYFLHINNGKNKTSHKIIYTSR